MEQLRAACERYSKEEKVLSLIVMVTAEKPTSEFLNASRSLSQGVKGSGKNKGSSAESVGQRAMISADTRRVGAVVKAVMEEHPGSFSEKM